MRGQSNGFTTFLFVLIVFGGFGFVLYSNSQSAVPARVIVPTQVEPTSVANAWQQVLREGFGDNSTPLPTLEIPAQPYIPPTLDTDSGPTMTPFDAGELSSSDLFTLEPVSVGVSPTPLEPTNTPPATADAQVTVQVVARQATTVWQPPPLSPPLNRDPLGRDHYYFARPMDSSATNFGIPYYPYGSDGPAQDNPLRIHHGIDMPNPIGTTVRAAGSGTVVFASTEETPYFQGSPSYGNVVFIEHDFGWQGQALYTLYAHLQAPLVQAGQTVSVGEPIGLVGNTGSSTGAHLHFEVRMGQDTYGSTYNPVLWMVPYVGHGTIAGVLVDERGNMLNDYNITLRNWSTGLVEATTRTYQFLNNVNDVNSDPNWGENFVFPDVPVGRYEILTNYEGQRLSRIVDVQEGMTSFVELEPVAPATPQPVTPDQ